MGYTKNIAVIRGLKGGFSADGGPLSGLVKAEKYGNSLKVEVSLINFAPLSEGRYVCAVSDGKHVCILDGLAYEGASEVDTGAGFAALICFVNGAVSPIASAVCGAYQFAAAGIKEEIEKQEKAVKNTIAPAEKYEDEALAEENYYEYGQTDENGGAVRENQKEEKIGQAVFENAQAFGTVEKDDVQGGLARGNCFYERMKDEIDKVFKDFPEEAPLNATVENSRWARITYGDGKFYVFGVIYGGGKPQYICYGVPATDSRRPPESLAGMASFIPASPEEKEKGYWVMYQDASTGASVKITSE